MERSATFDPSRTLVDDGRMPAVGASITAVRVASERKAVRNNMAARVPAGLLLCVGLLLTMPALAATPADRGECAASADKPDGGFAACSRMIDDASEPPEERAEALKNRGRGSLNGKTTTARLSTRRGHQAQPEGRLGVCTPSEAYEGKEDHDAAVATAPTRSRSTEIWLGLQQPWRRLLRSV